MKLTHQTSIERHDICKCPVCGSELVYPLERRQTGTEGWQLLMLCPDCFARQEVSVERGEMLEIFRLQHDGIEQVARQLAVLEQRHMSEECEKFIDALHNGHIVPEDF
jgi:hypothetical protein